MSIIDLNKRCTNDWDEMHRCMRSPDSKVFVDECNAIIPTSLDLEVGNAYIIPGSNQTFAISENGGLKVKPKRAVVIFTKQRLKLPHNVFGIVTGKGSLIFKGCFLSTGKIDPGFEGYLKIGIYNGGSSTIKLEIGTAFATAFFMNTDATLNVPLKNYPNNLNPDLPRFRWYQRARMYISEHWVSFVAWAIIAIPTAFLYGAQFIKLISEWSSQK